MTIWSVTAGIRTSLIARSSGSSKSAISGNVLVIIIIIIIIIKILYKNLRKTTHKTSVKYSNNKKSTSILYKYKFPAKPLHNSEF